MGQKKYESNLFVKTGGTSSQYLMADGSTSTGPSGGVDVGTGTANKVAKFSDSDTITNSTITDDGTDVSITGKLGVDTASPDSLIHIQHEDNNYDISRGLHVDYTKDHTGTGWSASAFAIRSTLTHSGTGKTTDVQAGRFQAEHTGTGIAYYLLGTQSKAIHSGSGDTGVMWGAFNNASITGTGVGTHPFLIGTNQKAELNNANASVGYMAGIVSGVKTTAGDVTSAIYAAWLEIDSNQGAATCVDAAVLYLKADTGNLTASGDVRAIHSNTTLPSLFLGTMETTSFIKTGGTSSQFLKADGSVDSSTYSTSDTQLTTEQVQDIIGGMVSSNTEIGISVTYNDTDGTLNFHASEYAHDAQDGDDIDVDTGALTGATVISDIDFNITSDATGHVTDANGSIATRTLTLADLGYTGATDANNATDFVSAAGGGTFSGDITADAFIIPGGSAGRFLKADGSIDATAYLSGAGTSGSIAIYDSASVLIDNSDLTFNFLDSKVTMGADLDVVGDIETANITTGDIEADTWTYIPQTFQSNFAHTGGNGYMNVPFNSLSDASSGGEQHFIVTPYSGYVYSVAFKNTGSGTAMTGTNMNFRILVNGIVSHTSSSLTFTAAARTFKGWTLSSTDALFSIGDDLRFQFQCTSGFWQDTCAVVVLKCLI